MCINRNDNDVYWYGASRVQLDTMAPTPALAMSDASPCAVRNTPKAPPNISFGASAATIEEKELLAKPVPAPIHKHTTCRIHTLLVVLLLVISVVTPFVIPIL